MSNTSANEGCTTVPRYVVMRVAFVCALIAVLIAACENTGALEEARAEFDKGHYREAVFILRHHAKRGGEETPFLRSGNGSPAPGVP